MDQKIDRRLVPEAIAVARAWHRIRDVGHRFHSARDDEIRITKLHRLGRQRYGTEPGTTDHVYRERGYFRRKTCFHRSLPRRSLTDAGLNHASHYHFVDLRGVDSRAFDRFLDRDRPELGGRKALQCSLKLPR